MRILFIGGTQFIGRHMATEALARGHDVTLFHLGSGPEDPLPEATHIHGDRATDLGVAEGEWDAVIDVCAYLPREVRAAAAAFADRTDRYCYVSTTDVYRRIGATTVAEDAPIWNASDLADSDPVEYDWDRYGELKALGEHEAMAGGFPHVTIVRPTYVLGPYDNTDRFPEWLRRIEAGGTVAAPAPPDAPQQLVDARDLAAFTVGLVERGVDGAFNGVAPTTTFGAMLEAVAEGLGSEVTFEWLSADEIAARGLEMPLDNVPEDEEICRCDPRRSAAEGLTHRPLTETVRDTWDWMRA